jgi:hypothetical protein
MGGDFSQKNVDCSKGIYALTGKQAASLGILFDCVTFFNSIQFNSISFDLIYIT